MLDWCPFSVLFSGHGSYLYRVAGGLPTMQATRQKRLHHPGEHDNTLVPLIILGISSSLIGSIIEATTRMEKSNCSTFPDFFIGHCALFTTTKGSNDPVRLSDYITSYHFPHQTSLDSNLATQPPICSPYCCPCPHLLPPQAATCYVYPSPLGTRRNAHANRSPSVIERCLGKGEHVGQGFDTRHGRSLHS